MTHQVVLSNDRGEIDRDELRAALEAMPGGGIFVREVDAGAGVRAIVVSDRPYGVAEAEAAYKARFGE